MKESFGVSFDRSNAIRLDRLRIIRDFRQKKQTFQADFLRLKAEYLARVNEHYKNKKQTEKYEREEALIWWEHRAETEAAERMFPQVLIIDKALGELQELGQPVDYFGSLSELIHKILNPFDPMTDEEIMAFCLAETKFLAGISRLKDALSALTINPF